MRKIFYILLILSMLAGSVFAGASGPPVTDYRRLTHKPITLSDVIPYGHVEFLKSDSAACLNDPTALAALAAMGIDSNHIACVTIGDGGASLNAIQLNIAGNSIVPTGDGGLTVTGAGITSSISNLSTSASGEKTLGQASVTITATGATASASGNVTLSGVTMVSVVNNLGMSQAGGDNVSLPGVTLTLSSSGPNSSGVGGITISGATLTISSVNPTLEGVGDLTFDPALIAFSLNNVTSVGAGDNALPSVSGAVSLSALAVSGVGDRALFSSSMVASLNNIVPVGAGSKTLPAKSLAGSLNIVVASAPPSPPTQSQLVNDPAQLTASWTDVTGETSYTVYYSTSASLDATTYNGTTAYSSACASPNSTCGKYIGIAANTTSKTISGPLTESTTYYTKISATNAAGESALSSSSSAAAAAAPIITRYPAASGDDVSTDSYGDLSTNDTAIVYGYDDSMGSNYDISVRFPNITIAKDATIDSAYLTFYEDSQAARTANIYICDSDNFTTFSNASPPCAGWSTFVSWSMAAASSITSPDIKTLIQHIVNRSGWASGNALALTVINTNNDNLTGTIWSFDHGNASLYPKLVVTYH